MSEKISEYAVVARMNELGIRKSQLHCFKSDKGVNRMMAGMMVTIETAKAVCNQLEVGYHELFSTVQSKNHQSYALPKLVDCDGGGVCIGGADRINKSAEKPKRPIPPAQSSCSQCGRLSIRFREVDGTLMCARCADIPRCADCHNPAHLLYIVDGRMICPRCDMRMQMREKETEASK